MDIVDVALLFHGKPYVWAGNHPTVGMDCSGYVCEVLRSVGYIGSEDLSAQMIFDKFKSSIKNIHRGSILFFGRSIDEITHVAIAINRELMIEAGGEGRVNTDKGYVRIRPINSRGDLVARRHLGGINDIR